MGTRLGVVVWGPELGIEDLGLEVMDENRDCIGVVWRGCSDFLGGSILLEVMWLRRVISIVGLGVLSSNGSGWGVLGLVLEWRIWRSGLALQSWELWFCVSLRVHVPNNYVLGIFVIAIRVKYMIIGPLVFRARGLDSAFWV